LKLFQVCYLCCSLLLLLGTIPNARAQGIGGPYVNIFWPRSDNYNFDIDLEITHCPPTSPGVLFWAHQFGFMRGQGGYMGLQVLNPQIFGSPKMAIFSIWGAVTGSTGQMIEEHGKVWRIVVPYDWRIGNRYRLRIWYVKQDSVGKWWVGAIFDYATGSEYQLGSIAIPANWGHLTDFSVTWTEYVGYPPENRPYTRAVFSNHFARNAAGDGQPVRLEADYGSAGVTDTNIRYYGGTRYANEAGSGVKRTTPPGPLTRTETEVLPTTTTTTAMPTAATSTTSPTSAITGTTTASTQATTYYTTSERTATQTFASFDRSFYSMALVIVLVVGAVAAILVILLRREKEQRQLVQFRPYSIAV